MTDARSTPPNSAAVPASSNSTGAVDSLESKLGPEIRNTGLRSREIDAIKGILIVCIALGHNGHFPAGVPFLYAFHVAGFLILPPLLLHAHRIARPARAAVKRRWLAASRPCSQHQRRGRLAVGGAALLFALRYRNCPVHLSPGSRGGLAVAGRA
jgi:hypothetical protein